MVDIDKRAGELGFCGAIRVTIDDDVVHDAAYGLADRARAIANTTETRFSIASGAKLLTALAVGALIDDGVITLETRLASRVDAAPDVTVEDLLGHTSGVYDYYDEELIDDFDSFVLPLPVADLRCAGDYLPMLSGEAKFPAGERFSYSNGGYVWLGVLVEELTGAPFHQLVADRVLAPAAMTRSGYFAFDQLPDDVAIGAVDTPDGWRTNDSLLPVIGGPDGGAYATTADVEKLWRALLGERILGPALTPRFLAPRSRYKPGTRYGLGVWMTDDEPPRLFLEGADAGVSFHSSCHAPTTIATVVSNTSEGAWTIAAEIDALIRDRRGSRRGGS